jgi:hypothetical protein
VVTTSWEQASNKGAPLPLSRGGEEETQEETPGVKPHSTSWMWNAQNPIKYHHLYSCTNVVLCVGCSTVLSHFTGGKARLTRRSEECSTKSTQWRWVGHYPNKHILDNKRNIKLYSENFKALLKETKEYLNKWNSSCSWTWYLLFLRWQYFPSSLRFNAASIKIPVDIFAEIDKLIPKFRWKFKGPRIANKILKKNKTEGLMLHDLKFYYLKNLLYIKTIIIKMMWYWHKEWNRIKRP